VTIRGPGPSWHCPPTGGLLLALLLAVGGHLVPRQAAAQVGGTSVTVHQGATLSTSDTFIPVGDLPLSLAPAPAGSLLAVLLTGDGGWAPVDKSLAAAFVRHNVAVVGLSSPAYLRRQRTPDEAARDLTRILRHFLDAWHRKRAIIVGYSRGADIGPFMLSRLPADLRERVALAALLGPGEWASFKFKLFDLVRDHAGDKGFPVSDEVAKLHGTSVLCVYGSKDRGAICPALGQAGLARAVVRAGGHRVYGNEGPALVDTILAALPKSN
jgi:type IV secretory pathway VirJ component